MCISGGIGGNSCEVVLDTFQPSNIECKETHD